LSRNISKQYFLIDTRGYSGLEQDLILIGILELDTDKTYNRLGLKDWKLDTIR